MPWNNWNTTLPIILLFRIYPYVKKWDTIYTFVHYLLKLIEADAIIILQSRIITTRTNNYIINNSDYTILKQDRKQAHNKHCSNESDIFRV